MTDCCSSLDTQQLQARQKRVLLIVLAINLVTCVMMVAAFVMSGASSLLSGMLDNLGDALTYAISFMVVGSSTTTKAKVALLKGILISASALAVAFQIIWRLLHMDTPVVEVMSAAAILNLMANGTCLLLLTPMRGDDVNMSSVWECSRNDVYEGLAVIAAAVAVWLYASGWPDVIIAAALLVLFARSAQRVLRQAWHDLNTAKPATV